MAYLPNLTNQDEEEDTLITQGSAPASVGGGGGGVASAAPNVAGTNTAQNQAPTNYGGSNISNIDGGGRNKPSSSGSFTNYQRYVDALAPQATRLAQQVTNSNMNRVNTGFDERLANAETQFNTQVGTANQYDEDLVNRATADPTAFLRNRADADRLEALRTADYTGPMSYADAGLREGLDSYRQKELDMANGMNTESGREAMLSGIDGYQGTRGQRLLDQYLLQNSAGAQDVFTKYGQDIDSGLTGKLSTATDIAKRRAAERDRLTDEARVQTQGTLTGSTTAERDTAEKDIVDRTQVVMDKLKTESDMNPAELRSAGITPEEWKQVTDAYGLAKQANGGRPFGNLLDAATTSGTPLIEGIMRIFAGTNPHSKKFLQQKGLYNTTPEKILEYMNSQAGVGGYSNLNKKKIPTLNYGDLSNVNIAGQTMQYDPYLLNGSVGATDEQRARYQALQQLAGIGETGRDTLTGSSRMMDTQSSAQAAMQAEAQQQAALEAEQKKRAARINSLLKLNATGL